MAYDTREEMLRALEAILFASGYPVKFDVIADVLTAKLRASSRVSCPTAARGEGQSSALSAMRASYARAPSTRRRSVPRSGYAGAPSSRRR